MVVTIVYFIRTSDVACKTMLLGKARHGGARPQTAWLQIALSIACFLLAGAHWARAMSAAVSHIRAPSMCLGSSFLASTASESFCGTFADWKSPDCFMPAFSMLANVMA